MKRAATETILGTVVEKPLLRLHAASSIELFWIAVQRVIEAVLPGSLVGLTLQHHPISPFIAKWSRPILDGSLDAKLIETYLIDHKEDLYGKTLRVAFAERLRGERAYHEVDELIAQMHRDVEDARRVCASLQRPSHP